MSSTWLQKQDAVKAAISKCLKLDVAGSVLLADGTYDQPSAVEWENKREASRGTMDYWCDLRLGSVLVLGRDEKRRMFVDNGSVLTSGLQTTYGGQRIFSVMCIVGSDNQDADKAAIGQLGSLIRTRLRREEVLDILQAADISINQIFTTLNVDYEDDGIMYSQSMTEVRFNTSEEDLPEPEVVTSYIAEVHGNGVAGEDLADVDLDVGPVL
jgi:hypothetical protein